MKKSELKQLIREALTAADMGTPKFKESANRASDLKQQTQRLADRISSITKSVHGHLKDGAMSLADASSLLEDLQATLGDCDDDITAVIGQYKYRV